jgi:hypothetical protein
MAETAKMTSDDDIAAIEPDDSHRRSSRIKYTDDVETGRGRLQRRHSNASSIRSISRYRSVDPGTLIPVEYRTV